MTVEQIIEILQGLPDDGAEVIIEISKFPVTLSNGARIHNIKYFNVKDIEDWSGDGFCNLVAEEVDLTCPKCDGWGKVEERVWEPAQHEPPPEPKTSISDCPKCNGSGELDIEQYCQQAKTYEPRLAKHLAEWNNLCRDLIWLYLGTGGKPDEYTRRISIAMEKDNLEDMNHLSALLLSALITRGKEVTKFSQRWGKLDKEYHRYFCESCIAQRTWMKVTR